MATTRTPVNLTPLKKACERRGVPYGSARDAAFRGEFRVFKSGASDRYARWHVDLSEFDQFIANRMVRLDDQTAEA